MTCLPLTTSDNSLKLVSLQKLFYDAEITSTGNDGYSGDLYSGNDGYSGLKPSDDAILFTVCGITAIADKKLEILIEKIDAELSKSRVGSKI